MSNYLLKPVFKSIFGKEFRPSAFEDRLEMQKSIYLLQSMGISVGEYRFMWYKHGPYSQNLQNDILNWNSEDVSIDFSADAKKVIDALRDAIFKKGIQYDTAHWVECLGSLLYIKENLLPSASGNETILAELKKRKPHLSLDIDNKLALETLEDLTV